MYLSEVRGVTPFKQPEVAEKPEGWLLKHPSPPVSGLFAWLFTTLSCAHRDFGLADQWGKYEKWVLVPPFFGRWLIVLLKMDLYLR
jgi:hypothetical protein